jgi:hypothetical protein
MALNELPNRYIYPTVDKLSITFKWFCAASANERKLTVATNAT